MIRVLAFALFVPFHLASATTVTNAVHLAAALKTLPLSTNRFDLTVEVSCVLINSSNTVIAAVLDESGPAWVVGPRPKKPFRPGDRIRFSGRLFTGNPAHTAEPRFRQAKVLRHGSPVRPRPSSAREIANGNVDWSYLCLQGFVRDVYPSETSPTFAVLILADEGELLRVNVPLLETGLDDLKPLLGRMIRVNGFPNLNNGSYRSFAGREFHCSGIAEITVLDPVQTDPFNVPALETLIALTPDQIATAGPVKTRGLVLCSWSRVNALVRTEFSDVVRIHCPQGGLPRPGTFVEASGLPVSDNFHITLTHTAWRTCTPFALNAPPVTEIPAFSRLTLDRSDKKARLHGHRVKAHGKIRSLPDSDIFKDTLLLEDGTSLIPVDTSSITSLAQPLEAGSVVEISGTYVMVAEYEHIGFPFSKAAGFQIILSDPNDLRVLRNPPWWTTGRLAAVIGTLLVALAGILVWNVTLRRLAACKGKELFREQLGHVKADLRTEERTRLAVELHDTLAQNLTGVSMEIEAANDLRGEAPQPMLEHLGIAAKALKSCRDELRNCLWDLRSQALEEADMTQAILRTLQPCVTDSQLAVRFEVPRARLSDNTAHALLRVIRELVVNAIRHGAATSIKVAGTLDGDRLLCSVTDNGRGFDPDAAPGILQGHFGLQGIRERIDELGGDFTLASTPGKGTKATIAVPIPREVQTR